MKRRNIAVIGAGYAGQEIAGEILKKEFPGNLLAIIDDDRTKIGTDYKGVPVLGPLERIPEIMERYRCDEVIIAIPSAESSLIRQIYEKLRLSGVSEIRIVPAVSQVLDGTAHLIQAREIAVQDLLGRNPVSIPLKESLKYLRGKRVLITGAGGSIGSELCRQLLDGGADRLYLFDHGENNVYEIDRELHLLQEEGIGEKATIVPIVGELKDRDYINFLMQRLKADIVFHCAAYKHVPMMENNPVEAIKNNVFGTEYLLEAAENSTVNRFILISTDKAVSPSSTYGVSKQICEQLVLFNNSEKLDCMVVRFGNVLESRGSIVPLFKNQILKGGPVTITDPEANRFFMTIPEASSLVLQTAGVGKGGEIYILDMGEPVNIKNLAEQMIRFYGYKPEKEIQLKYIGLRKGEKVSENLWESDEKAVPTDYRRILRLERNPEDMKKIKHLLRNLYPVCYLDKSLPDLYRNRLHLRKILSEYAPSLEIPPDEPEY